MVASVLLAAALLSPPARSAIKAVALILDVLPSPLRPLRVLTPTPQVATSTLDGTGADVYEPAGFSKAPGVVLVHGAAPKGKQDPRLRELAFALSRTGRRVIVPDLGLKYQRLDVEDESRIRRAIEFAAGDSKAGVLAFSYGAALCLVALGEQTRIQEKVAFVGTVGTYFDVTHLIQGVTTGTVPFRGRNLPWKPHPRAKELLPGQFAHLLGSQDGPAFLSAWQRKDPEGLAPGARAAFELLANRDPSRVASLESALPAELRKLLHELSPASVVDRLGIPVFALHSANDPASPASESRLLVQALDRRVKAKLYEVTFLQHVDPTRSVFSNIGEGMKIMRFAFSMLRSQEGWPRP